MTSYTSLIDNLTHVHERVVVPQGKNIASNSSPSMPAANGALVGDLAYPGSLFIGNGSTWVASSTAFAGQVANVTGITLSLATQPDLAGCTLNMRQEIVGSVTLNLFNLKINQTVASSASGDYTVSAAVPALFRPSGTQYIPCVLFTSAGTPNYVDTYCLISSGGNITLHSSISTGNLGFSEITGIY